MPSADGKPESLSGSASRSILIGLASALALSLLFLLSIVLFIVFGVNSLTGLGHCHPPPCEPLGLTVDYFRICALVALATPVIGFRAMSGDHFFARVGLTSCGIVFLVGAALLDRPGGVWAVWGASLTVLAVALFAWWKSPASQWSAERP